jgi:hypothetical protein
LETCGVCDIEVDDKLLSFSETHRLIDTLENLNTTAKDRSLRVTDEKGTLDGNKAIVDR